MTPGAAERLWNRREEKEGGKTYTVPKATPFSRESMHIWGRLLITLGRGYHPGSKGRPQENWIMRLIGGTSGNQGHTPAC